MDNPDFTRETVIGHHVAARVKEDSKLREFLNKEARQLGIEPISSPTYVKIEVGDVDWDNTKTVSLRVETLRDILKEVDEDAELD